MWLCQHILCLNLQVCSYVFVSVSMNHVHVLCSIVILMMTTSMTLHIGITKLLRTFTSVRNNGMFYFEYDIVSYCWTSRIPSLHNLPPWSPSSGSSPSAPSEFCRQYGDKQSRIDDRQWLYWSDDILWGPRRLPNWPGQDIRTLVPLPSFPLHYTVFSPFSYFLFFLFLAHANVIWLSTLTARRADWKFKGI